MRQDREVNASGSPACPSGKKAWWRFFRSKDGAAAIEFAILAVPYFIIVFAIIETFVAYTGEQLVGNAVDTMARKLRTGNITAIAGHPNFKDRTQFRQLFCNEISILIQCSAQEVATPDKLWLDVRSFASFALIPTTIPRLPANSTYGELNTGAIDNYAPGGAKSINMLRAYYKWEVITDLIRPYITNVRPTDGSRPYYFLIVETAAFQNEDYP